jgi:hypothetical protein
VRGAPETFRGLYGEGFDAAVSCFTKALGGLYGMRLDGHSVGLRRLYGKGPDAAMIWFTEALGWLHGTGFDRSGLSRTKALRRLLRR